VATSAYFYSYVRSLDIKAPFLYSCRIAGFLHTKQKWQQIRVNLCVCMCMCVNVCSRVGSNRKRHHLMMNEWEADNYSLAWPDLTSNDQVSVLPVFFSWASYLSFFSSCFNHRIIVYINKWFYNIYIIKFGYCLCACVHVCERVCEPEPTSEDLETWIMLKPVAASFDNR